MKFNALESTLFSFSEYQVLDSGDYLYRDVVLTAQVGDLPAGSKFELAAFLIGTSMLAFGDLQKPEHYFKVSLLVGERLDAAEVEATLTHQHTSECTHHSN